MAGLLEEAVSYFKSEKAYQKLFSKIKEKYESLGRIAGTVPVDGFTMEELEIISRFFGESAGKLMEKGSISIQKFAKQLQKTRYQGIELKSILDAFFGEEIQSKKRVKQWRKEELEALFDHLHSTYPPLGKWFEHVMLGSADTRWIIRLAEKDPRQFEKNVFFLAKAFSCLPKQAERFPFFSQRITGNPHSFDLNTELGKLFLHVLAVYHSSSGEIVIPKTTEGKNDLLNEFGIYRDDLLNFVTCSGFLAEMEDRTLHPVWEAAVEAQSVLNQPLREIMRVKRIFPKRGKKVWIVENSGVGSMILDYEPHVPLICANGQFKLASLLMMDKLVKEECELYYSGDFDPEGLGMAQRLLERYPGQVRLWHMTIEDYHKTNPNETINQTRMEKLGKITNNELLSLAEEMKKIKKAGYQESLIKELIGDIRESKQ